MKDFKVGDKVVFADPNQIAWQGGLGVVESFDESYNHYNVEILELPPLNNLGHWTVGSMMCDSASNLKLAVTAESVEHPAHYGGDTTYEVIKVAEAWGLDKDAYLFNVVKYVARAGKKDSAKELEDLKKSEFYLSRRIKQLEESSLKSS